MILLLLLVMKLRVEELKNRESTVVEFLGGVSKFGQCNRVLLITYLGRYSGAYKYAQLFIAAYMYI